MEIAAEHVRRTFLPDIPTPECTQFIKIASATNLENAADLIVSRARQTRHSQHIRDGNRTPDRLARAGLEVVFERERASPCPLSEPQVHPKASLPTSPTRPL